VEAVPEQRRECQLPVQSKNIMESKLLAWFGIQFKMYFSSLSSSGLSVESSPSGRLQQHFHIYTHPLRKICSSGWAADYRKPAQTVHRSIRSSCHPSAT
jgi:hypothetical protein